MMNKSSSVVSHIRERLFAMKDSDYKDFHSKLIPNINSNTIIGVRTPALRAFAKELFNSENKDTIIHDFFDSLPHSYYEENNLHAFLIAQIKDFTECVAELEHFLPHVDNWATCDAIRPICFKKHPDKLLCKIREWISSTHIYTARFGIEMLMVHFLDNHFSVEYLGWVANLQSDEYYINMMIAWYFATALAKQYEATLPFISKKRMSKWVHNKTIQKAIESYRITDAQKAYLKTLRITAFT